MRRKSFLSLFEAFVMVSVAGCGTQSPEVVTVADTLSTNDVIARAESWVQDGHMLYCQAANHQHDGVCGYTCVRTNNPAWDPYRSDCSGFVSWSWGLPSPGRVTTQFAPFDNTVSHAIDGSSLQPGDALNNADHIFLFKEWLTVGQRARFIEEGSCNQVAKEFDSDVSINGQSVFVTWQGKTFTAIRLNGITSTPPHRQIARFQGDYNGDGRTDFAFYSSGDGNWFSGLSDGSKLGWRQISNTTPFGDLADGNHWIASGDFDHDAAHTTDFAFYYAGDGNWFIGHSDGQSLSWRLAGNTVGFGSLLDGRHWMSSGDFDQDGKTDVVMYFAGDGNWFIGHSDGEKLTWRLAGNTAGFGNLLDGNHRLYTGDFDGDGKTDVLMYYAGDGNWFIGHSDGEKLTWRLAGNTAGYGNLLDGNHRLYTGDFDGDGKADVVMYYASNGDWFRGLSDGDKLNWSGAGNTSAFGNLADANHNLYFGDFDGNGKMDMLFYYRGDGNWFAGLSDGNKLDWTAFGNTAGYGNLLDGRHDISVGDYNGDHRSDVLFYYNGDGNWFRGLSDGHKLDWDTAGNTAGFGDLLR
jgi:VCBS repeat protein